MEKNGFFMVVGQRYLVLESENKRLYKCVIDAFIDCICVLKNKPEGFNTKCKTIWYNQLKDDLQRNISKCKIKKVCGVGYEYIIIQTDNSFLAIPKQEYDCIINVNNFIGK